MSSTSTKKPSAKASKPPAKAKAPAVTVDTNETATQPSSDNEDADEEEFKVEYQLVVETGAAKPAKAKKGAAKKAVSILALDVPINASYADWREAVLNEGVKHHEKFRCDISWKFGGGKANTPSTLIDKKGHYERMIDKIREDRQESTRKPIKTVLLTIEVRGTAAKSPLASTVLNDAPLLIRLLKSPQGDLPASQRRRRRRSSFLPMKTTTRKLKTKTSNHRTTPYSVQQVSTSLGNDGDTIPPAPI